MKAKSIFFLILVLTVVVFSMVACTFMPSFSFLDNLVLNKDEIADDEIEDNNSNNNDGIQTPDTPSIPDGPSTPSEPEAPSEPSSPIIPDEPNEPVVPDDPVVPDTPAIPDEPEAPEQPEESIIVTLSKTATDIAKIYGNTANATVIADKILKLDNNISIEFTQNGGNAPPAYYTDAIRMYQNGNSLTIKADNGKVLKEIVITYGESYYGGTKLQVEGCSAPQKNDNPLTFVANNTSTEITITSAGTQKSHRLYIESIAISYYGSISDIPTEKPDDNPPIPDEPEDTTHTYTDFTPNEKTTYNSYIGFVIPFFANDDYAIEAYEENGYKGVYFSALCANESEFSAYLLKYSSYSNDGTEVDEDNDTWYLYSKGDVFIDICYYEYEGDYYVDVDAYYELNNTSSGGNNDNTQGGTGTSGNEEIITNAGAGLPLDTDGVYDIDFTKASKVRNVTELGYYIDGCPTVGSPKVLVIPVEFTDLRASTKGYSIEAIKNAFEKDGDTDYYSVYDYYYKSSFGKLTLDITVLDEWFCPSKTSTYYATQTMDYEGTETMIGDQMVMDEALAYLEDKMDLSSFDSDNNDIIDAVVFITTLNINSEKDFYWAYRYWNLYTDDEGYYYEYDNVSANDYLWAPYQFLFEDLELTGDYTNTSNMNTYTFIHEFGHVLGADDYYDYTGENSPMGGYDMMDIGLGDHNAYTKFNLGWLTTSRLVVTNDSIKLSLEDFSKNGDTLIIANNWDETLGVYQEYYILAYYTNNGLNSNGFGYFEEEGIVVYHINASLYEYDYDGKTYYDIYNTNTDDSDEYGTYDNLIEYVTMQNGDYVYGVRDTLPSIVDDQGNTLCYSFTIDALTDESATITFNKK